MRVIPAVDLLDGKVVRLHQGKYDAVTPYPVDPIDMARQFQKLGFSMLHVIDLGGAKAGRPTASAVVEEIAALRIDLQVGGGIRSIETAKQYLDAGAKRVIVGTRAIRDPLFFQELVAICRSDALMLSVDLRANAAAVEGWTETTSLTLSEVIASVGVENLRHLIVTDISRDGTLKGCNIAFYQKLCEEYPTIQVYAAGGASSLSDAMKLEEAGVAGMIVGRAFYENAGLPEQLAEKYGKERASC